MPELPEYMRIAGRAEDQQFAPDEMLYRRVRPEDWSKDGVELDAIQLPDMSVSRSKYGPPDSVRWFEGDYHDWGVIGFRVRDIPESLQDRGAFIYRFMSVHRPLRFNYPHSEVQAFESSANIPDSAPVHINKNRMGQVSRELHLRWRWQLMQNCRIVLHPGEEPASR